MSDDEGPNCSFECESVTTDVCIRADGSGREVNGLLELLSSHQRRYALYHLRETEITDVQTLAREVAQTIANEANESLTETRVERTKTQVVHVHLPRLREAGLVEYDSRSDTVRYRQPSEATRDLLRVCLELETPAVN